MLFYGTEFAVAIYVNQNSATLHCIDHNTEMKTIFRVLLLLLVGVDPRKYFTTMMIHSPGMPTLENGD